MESRIGINGGHSQSVAELLAKLLADEFLLSLKTRNAHWNIEDPNFLSLHKLFETQYGELDTIVDDVAERIRSLGHFAPASMKSFLSLTHLTEAGREKNDGRGFITELLHDHEDIIIRIRSQINELALSYHDVGTSDFFTGLMKTHEKMAWMLRAHVG